MTSEGNSENKYHFVYYARIFRDICLLSTNIKLKFMWMWQQNY